MPFENLAEYLLMDCLLKEEEKDREIDILLEKVDNYLANRK
jgi:hypothetical protein